jgi:hypothetical protein
MDTTPEDFLGAVPSNPALIELDEALVLAHEQFRRLYGRAEATKQLT